MVINQKNPGTAALIGFFGGLFGLQGLGQIYTGRAGRGLAILATSITVYAFVWISFFGSLVGTAIFRQNLFGYGISLSVILVFAYVGMFIWQILDARSCAEKHNERLQESLMSAAADETDTEAA